MCLAGGGLSKFPTIPSPNEGVILLTEAPAQKTLPWFATLSGRATAEHGKKTKASNEVACINISVWKQEMARGLQVPELDKKWSFSYLSQA
jgi:hypothetical protein